MQSELATTIADAERALRRAWDETAVDLLPLNPSDAVRSRSIVARCLLRTAHVDAPATVIVKSTRGYDIADRTPESAAGRLLNEWQALEFLSGTNLSPRLYATDRDAGVLVLEDLGDGASLIDLLNQPDSAAGSDALNQYARGLGTLHARTASLAAPRRDPFVQAWPARNLPPLHTVLTDVGVEWTKNAEEELQIVVRTIAETHDFLALSQGDTCPENHRFTDCAVRFLDFEFCGFRHALLDAAFLWLPFPTCQDVQRLPRDDVQAATAAYRSTLAAGCPAANDTERFERELLIARAWWTVLSLGAYLPRALDEDQLVGTATIRQRLLLWLETFSADAHSLPALGNLASTLHDKLTRRWRTLAVPLYPAFNHVPR